MGVEWIIVRSYILRHQPPIPANLHGSRGTVTLKRLTLAPILHCLLRGNFNKFQSFFRLSSFKQFQRPHNFQCNHALKNEDPLKEPKVWLDWPQYCWVVIRKTLSQRIWQSMRGREDRVTRLTGSLGPKDDVCHYFYLHVLNMLWGRVAQWTQA